MTNKATIFLLTDCVGDQRRAGAYNIAATLRQYVKNTDVEVIDFVSKWDIEDLIECLDRFTNISWVGISAAYLTYNTVNEFIITRLPKKREQILLDYLKSRNIAVVVGGANAEILKNNYEFGFYFVIGYAEAAVKVIHDHIINNEYLKYSIVNTNNCVNADIDYPVNNMDNLFSEYTNSDFIDPNSSYLPIEISRGCIFKCAFCEFKYLGKKKGTYVRPKEDIKKDILNFHSQFNCSFFAFVDDTLNDTIEKLEMLRDIRNELNIDYTFWSYCRLDLLSQSQEMFDLIGQIGLSAVTFGVETFNKSSGKKIHKGANPDKLKQCLLDFRKKYPHIHVQTNFIIGLPFSSKEEIKQSIDWMIDNNTTDYLRVVDLDIRDNSKNDHGSLMSMNPKKFNFEIISSDNFRYKWRNESFDSESAKRFADEINGYIDSKKPNNKPLHSFRNKDEYKRYIPLKIQYLRAASITTFITTFLG